MEGDAPLTRFLIVEDSRTVRAYLAGLVRSAFPDAEILEADGVAAARAVVAERQPSVVVTDLMLAPSTRSKLTRDWRQVPIPDAGGIEVAKAALDAGAKVVVVTALPPDDAAVLEAIAAGASTVLQKPVSRHEFVTMLERAVADRDAGGRPRAPAVDVLPESLRDPGRGA